MRDFFYRARTRLLTAVLRRASRPGRARLGGLELTVAQGVHHPAPLLGLNVAPLQIAALDALEPGARVLELGTGAGFWALAAAGRGFCVTATDLPEVTLEPLREATARLGLTLRLQASDLFLALGAERFDAVLFNPPFHDAEPHSLQERAWCGAAVMRRFFAALPHHLTPGGAGWILLPRAEQERYAAELLGFDVRRRASRWFPLLGRVELLELTPAARATGSSRPEAAR